MELAVVRQLPAKWSRLPRFLYHGGLHEKSCRGIPCAFRVDRPCRRRPRKRATHCAEPPALATRRNFQLQIPPAFPHRGKVALRRSGTPRGSRPPRFATGITAARIPTRPRRAVARFGQGTPGARKNSEVPRFDPHGRWRTFSRSACARQRRARHTSRADERARLTRALRKNIL